MVEKAAGVRMAASCAKLSKSFSFAVHLQWYVVVKRELRR